MTPVAPAVRTLLARRKIRCACLGAVFNLPMSYVTLAEDGNRVVAKIELAPANPIVQQVGLKQQIRVLATYVDGEVRDVTREAFVESGNTEVVSANKSGLMTSLRRGEGVDEVVANLARLGGLSV